MRKETIFSFFIMIIVFSTSLWPLPASKMVMVSATATVSCNRCQPGQERKRRIYKVSTQWIARRLAIVNFDGNKETELDSQ